MIREKWEAYKRWKTKALIERLKDVKFHRQWSLARGENAEFYNEQVKAIEEILKERGAV